MRFGWTVVGVASLVFVLSGCEAQPDQNVSGGDGRDCVDGASAACTCRDGRSGAQTCADSRFGRCECEGAGGAGGQDSGAGGQGGGAGGQDGGAGGQDGGEPENRCGDSDRAADEECDDGNTRNGDGCDSQCRVEEVPAPECGNREQEADEACDDGNTRNGDGCDSQCRVEEAPAHECGNGDQEAGEECDDGNRRNADGCSAECRREAPRAVDISAGGNFPAGFIEGGSDVFVFSLPAPALAYLETSDGAGGCPGDTVMTLFRVDANGQRDLIGENDDAAPSENVCSVLDLPLDTGDYEVVVAGYMAAAVADYVLRAEFSAVPAGEECGNGDVEAGEECDDGNLRAGDGCNANCRREAPAEGDVEGTLYFGNILDIDAGVSRIPGIIAHLYGREVEGPAIELVCYEIHNPRRVAVDVVVDVRLAGFSEPQERSFRVDAGADTAGCLSPAFDLDALANLAEPVRRDVAANMRVRGSQEPFASFSESVEVLPINRMPWSPNWSGLISDFRNFISAMVLPRHPELVALQDDLNDFTQRPNGLGVGGYALPRAIDYRTGEIEDGFCHTSPVYLEDGERVRLEVTGFRSGNDIDLYIVDGATEEVMFSAADAGIGGWVDSGEVPAGWYVLYLCTPASDIINRDVDFRRNWVRSDLAKDYLSTVFELVRSRGVDYANLNQDYFAREQPIRRPDDAVAGMGANCIDGTLLFASFLEMSGVDPILIVSLANGHAFVGMRSGPNGEGVIWAIETTYVGEAGASTADAIERGKQQLDCWEADIGCDEAGAVFDPDLMLIDVRALRTLGYAPQPQR